MSHLNCACVSSGASIRGTCETEPPDALTAYREMPTAWIFVTGVQLRCTNHASSCMLETPGAAHTLSVSSAAGRVVAAHIAGLPADRRKRCHGFRRKGDVGVRHEHHVGPRGGYEGCVGLLKGVTQHQHIPAPLRAESR